LSSGHGLRGRFECPKYPLDREDRRGIEVILRIVDVADSTRTDDSTHRGETAFIVVNDLLQDTHLTMVHLRVTAASPQILSRGNLFRSKITTRRPC
jgi:hypothetical protein